MTRKIQQQPGQAAPRPTNEQPSNDHKKSVSKVASFSDHVGELRKRIFIVALVFLLATSLAYNYHDFFVALIMMPLGQEKLIYLTPGGGFNFIFQVSLYAGLLAAAPILIYQLYGFIKPALPQRARRSASSVVAAAFLLMLCGVAFGYFVAVPSALTFLSTFAGEAISPNLTADSYLSFFLAYIAGLGILFELPLLLLFFHWIHPMTPGSLLKSERIIILVIFILAAIITPTPDIFNQAMIAGPLILIYQFGVVAVLFTIRNERRRAERSTKRQIAPGHAKEPLLRPAVASAISTPQQPLPTPVVSARAPVVTPVPRRRTVDGFGGGQRSSVRPISRPPVPAQRTVVSSSIPSRRQLSIDGFSIAG